MASGRRIDLAFYRFLKDRFNLDTDRADDEATLDYIRKGVEFKGANLWILIFAVLICSIGLNVNSTAVVIGAMLISPLMGPILGIGTGVAINDPELLKRSTKNLVVATLFSVVASTVYFWVTPISVAQSELLARTNPTVWDVLIAFFGGLAGIVAGSRKEKSNAIPGVAIATALMPPLCTAGYGLATGNGYYFIGAFYLFFINSVCISIATFVIVRLLRFPKKEFVDVAQEKRVKTWMTVLVLITLLPSVWLAYQTVKRSIFEQNANLFIEKELRFEKARVIAKNIIYNNKQPVIEVTLFGEHVSEELLEDARSEMANYNLSHASLNIIQGYDPAHTDTEVNNKALLEELLRKNERQLRVREEQLKELENELTTFKQITNAPVMLAPEVKVLFPDMVSFSISRSLTVRLDSLRPDTTYVAWAQYRKSPSRAELRRLREWLATRMGTGNLQVIAH
ncbi:MAG: membrane protein [Cyclobacteriaceae bacterium]|nr:MAG: membrane protein [Cyclobacteriaceae bacterium]